MGECSSVVLEQNSEQDTLAALLVHSQSCRMKSTADFEMNQVWTCFVLNIQCRSGFVFLLCIVKMRVCCVQSGSVYSNE